MIEIEIPGKPIAKKRPKFARRGKFVQTYNPQESEEGKIRWEAYRQLPDGWKPLKTPIKIITIFYIERPKSHYGTGKNSSIIRKTAPAMPLSKPDIDNLQKIIYDCLNNVIWCDDSQICEAIGKKYYSDIPRTTIRVEEIDYG